MENDFRNKMKNFGDMMFDKIDHMYDGIKNTMSQSTRGIKLTYNIQELQKEKDMLHKMIGRRITKLKNQNPEKIEQILQDENMRRFFYRLDVIDDEIEAYLIERKTRLKKE